MPDFMYVISIYMFFAIVGYGTGRVLLPLLSRGHIVVLQAGVLRATPLRFGMARDLEGKLIVNDTIVALTGAVVWFFVAKLFAAAWPYLWPHVRALLAGH